jgi:V8-like Glu-specific endopeptidase
VRITPTSDTPWRWICHIALEDGRQRSEGHGSGILISDRHVLTAAHVVYDMAKDRQLHFARVSPGLDYDSSPFGTWSVSQVRVCPKYDPSDDKNLEWDYALVTLDKAVG